MASQDTNVLNVSQKEAILSKQPLKLSTESEDLKIEKQCTAEEQLWYSVTCQEDDGKSEDASTYEDFETFKASDPFKFHYYNNRNPNYKIVFDEAGNPARVRNQHTIAMKIRRNMDNNPRSYEDSNLGYNLIEDFSDDNNEPNSHEEEPMSYLSQVTYKIVFDEEGKPKKVPNEHKIIMNLPDKEGYTRLHYTSKKYVVIPDEDLDLLEKLTLN